MSDLDLQSLAGEPLPALGRAAVARHLGVPCAAPPLEPWMDVPGCCFVTLRLESELRGCVGSLAPRRPLIEDLRSNAVAAATRDERFPPLAAEELCRVQFEVSVLGGTEPLQASSREELLTLLADRPGGLTVEWERVRATFLPQVWSALPDASEFLGQLMRKAGLEPGFWDSRLRFSRYEVRSWVEPRSHSARNA